MNSIDKAFIASLATSWLLSILIWRARRYQRPEILPAPWDGAIVRTPRYYCRRWTRKVGEALRG